jgi:hypothetical protein
MGDPKKVDQVTLDKTTPYYEFFTEKTMNVGENHDDSFNNYFFEQKKNSNDFNIKFSKELNNKYFSSITGKRKRKTETETKTSNKRVQSAQNTLTNGENYLAQGGVSSIERRISASNNDAQAQQTRESADFANFNLHRSFFLIIWEHFAPNANIRERPRRYDTNPLNVRLPPMYSRAGNRVCSVLLRCVRRVNNIAYSVLFEFTNYIHWSIFYSFDISHLDSDVSNQQVSELHFTLNPYPAEDILKTRMFFKYTPYINDLIRSVHYAMEERGLHIVSSKAEQVQIMEIVSKLMLLTMYQLATAKSYKTGFIFNNNALTMRQNIDIVGKKVDVPNNQLLNIALRHVDLIDCIQAEFRRSPKVNFASEDFINYLKRDICREITPARPGGGKNINRYLTKINNIKEMLKLLKKNKIKNKVKITKLNKSIEELKAKLKKQKEKEKAKLKKQKEKEKAKLKKQKEKEKEKAKLKKQKEKEKAKLKKQKEKKKASKKKKT